MANELPVKLVDGAAGQTASNLGVTVAQFHNADNQILAASAQGILTGGVAQFINSAGNVDRQRETGLDSIAAVGVATGSAQFAMAFKTTDSTDNFAAGTRTFTPALMSGTVQGVAWSIQVGSVLTLDAGVAKETVVVTAVTATTFTCVTAQAHNGTVTAFPITGFVYNQERDASGELDGATGSGTAVAAEYEYNGGGPSGASNANFDRARNLQGKGRTTTTINSTAMSATTNVTSIVLTAVTNLQPGQPIYFDLIGAANFEVLYVALNYVAGSLTVLLQSPGNQQTHANGVTVAWDTYAGPGPGLNGFLPTGVGIEEEALWSPANNLYYIERSADSDAMAVPNIVAECPAIFNGTTFDRWRSVPVAGSTTGIPVVSSKIPLTASAPTSATVGVASAQVIAANANRKGLVLMNTSANTISFGLGATAVLNNGITLIANGTWEMDEWTFFTGAINAISSAASSNLAIQELTT